MTFGRRAQEGAREAPSLLYASPHATLRLLRLPPPGRLPTDRPGQRWKSRTRGLWRGRGPRNGDSSVSAGEAQEGRWRRSWSPRCRPSTGVCWNVRLRRPRGNGCKQLTSLEKYISIWPIMYPKSTAGVPTLFHRKKTRWHTKFCWDQWNGTFVVKILGWDFQNLNKQTNRLIFVVVFLKWESLHTLAETVQLIQLVFYAWSAFWEVFTETIDIG